MVLGLLADEAPGQLATPDDQGPLPFCTRQGQGFIQKC